MKRSKVVMLTLAGVSLSVTGCHREPERVNLHSTPVLPPESLSPAARASLPVYRPGSDVSRTLPPHNAYDPQLGYYHEPCAAWFPYPYDHYDSRWGYYRCGRWSRYHSTQAYSPSSIYFRGGNSLFGSSMPLGGGTGARPDPNVPRSGDYGLQPSGAPIHNGVQHGNATRTISSVTSRGGFGTTGRSSGFFSGS
jgi:hypothetical protein